MLRKPRFEQADIDRVKGQWIAGIKQEKVNPGGIIQRVVPGLVYGSSHPYGAPRTGSGTEASIAGLTRADLVGFHGSALRPGRHPGRGRRHHPGRDRAGAGEALRRLDGDRGSLGGLDAPGGRAAEEAARVPDRPARRGAGHIVAAQLAPSSMDPAAVAFDMANMVLGGDFTSRLNMNLREDKHWSYGARSGAGNSVGPRMWTASAPVQIDKTAESVAEMKREIADFASGKQGATAEEVSGMQKILTLSLPGAYETAASVMGTIGSNLLYGRPDDYVFKRKAEIEAMTPAQVDVAAKALDPNALTWVVVGDLSKTEQVVRALNLGEVTILDADGKPVAKK
jgi:zinc protease